MNVSAQTTSKVNKNKRRSLVAIAIPIFTFTLTILFVMPYISLVFTSLKPAKEIFSVPPTFFPSQLTLENYRSVGQYLPIGKYFYNSVVVATTSTALSLLIGGLAAYRISRVRTKLNDAFLLGVLATRMIPYITIAIPIYRLIGSAGLMDTKLALIFVYTCLNVPFVIWLMVGFFDGVPKELDEAAKVDGCNSLGAFVRIILPISIPGFATTAIFSFMLSWNDFLFALLLTSLRSKTVPIGISEFMTVYNLNWGPMSAAAIMFSLPVLILTFVIQKRIVGGLTFGAVKG